MCPEKPTAWGGTKNGNQLCCLPETCKEEAAQIADAYINILEKVYNARTFCAGWLGNWLIGVDDIFGGDDGENYLSPESTPDIKCTGWTRMAEVVLSEILGQFTFGWKMDYGSQNGNSQCWTIDSKKKGVRYINYHEWAFLRLMDADGVDLDPWESGGWTY